MLLLSPERVSTGDTAMMAIGICSVGALLFLLVFLSQRLYGLDLNPLRMNRERKLWYLLALKSSSRSPSPHESKDV